jgi:PqqD family protein of HPr-rel-A system
MNNESDVRWAAPGIMRLYWEGWGEQHAVFDLRSGETHMLSDLTACVLKHLVHCPSTVKEVAEELCVTSNKICNERFMENIEWIFLQLQNAGLIEKAGK